MHQRNMDSRFRALLSGKVFAGEIIEKHERQLALPMDEATR
jgi:hypothetical protein